MLLDLELKLKITNDGKNNNLQIIINPDVLLKDMGTAIELAKYDVVRMLEQTITKNGDGSVTEEEFKKIYDTITVGDAAQK